MLTIRRIASVTRGGGGTMKITKQIEVNVEIEIPWKFAKSGEDFYLANTQNSILILADKSIYWDETPSDCTLYGAIECPKSEFMERLDVLVTEIKASLL